MKTLTQLIEQELQETTFRIFDSAESKKSSYWFLWDSKNGEMPESTREDDYRLTKLRVSDHDAMCGRSMSDNEIIEECFSGELNYNVELDFIDTDSEEGEVREALEESFEMSFNDFSIEEISFCGCKIATKNYDAARLFKAKALTKNLK